ncbi:MAG: hypothetical protein WDW36_003307 [Sanguina aurantia]
MCRVRRSSTQGSVEPFTVVQHPCAWKASDYADESLWQYHLTEDDITEIQAALAVIEGRGIAVEDLRKEDFVIPVLGAKLLAIRDEVLHGRGFSVIRGFPVDRLTRAQTVATYYAFGLLWGEPQAQNAKGHILGHIKAIGTDATQEGTRPYTTNVAHGYHCDGSDIVGLLCLKDAAEGGVSNWASSISVHNEMLRRGRQDLVQVLSQGTFWLPAHNAWGNPQEAFTTTGADPNFINFPVFNYHHGYLSVNYAEGSYYYYYRHPDAPRLSELEQEALRMFTSLAKSDELRLDYKLMPGDLALLNNLTMLHAKTAFTDHQDPKHGRHLLRLWVAPPNAPPLDGLKPYEVKWGSTKVGSRGGYWIGHGYKRSVPLDAEYGDLEAAKPGVATILAQAV